VSNLGYIQMSLKNPLLSVSPFCHLASIILCALIFSETLALYKSFTYLLTYICCREIRRSIYSGSRTVGILPTSTAEKTRISIRCWWQTSFATNWRFRSQLRADQLAVPGERITSWGAGIKVSGCQTCWFASKHVTLFIYLNFHRFALEKVKT